MAKYLRFDTAIISKVYIEIAEQAEQLLIDHGCFEKDEVIKRAGYQAIEDDIRWDYVRRMLEIQHETELIPLASSYFKRHRREDEINFTERYIAKGNGRKTAGYASVCEQNGHFVLHRIQSKTKLSEAFAKSAARTRQIGIERGAIPDATKPVLKQISGGK